MNPLLASALVALLVGLTPSCYQARQASSESAATKLKTHIVVSDANLYIWDCVGIKEIIGGHRSFHEGLVNISGAVTILFANNVTVKNDNGKVTISGEPAPVSLTNLTVIGDAYEAGAFVATFH